MTGPVISAKSFSNSPSTLPVSITTNSVNAPAGSSVWVMVWEFGGNAGQTIISSVIDSNGKSYTKKTTYIDANANDSYLSLWVLDSSTGGAALTVTVTTNGDYQEYLVVEVLAITKTGGSSFRSAGVGVSNASPSSGTTYSSTATSAIGSDLVLLWVVQFTAAGGPTYSAVAGETLVDANTATGGGSNPDLSLAVYSKPATGAGSVSISTKATWAGVAGFNNLLPLVVAGRPTTTGPPVSTMGSGSDGEDALSESLEEEPDRKLGIQRWAQGASQ